MMKILDSETPTGLETAEQTSRRRLMVLVLLLALTSMMALATVATSSEDGALDPLAEGLSLHEQLDALIARVKYEQGRIQTMVVDFEKSQNSELLLEPETTRGTFYYKSPDMVRWVDEEPYEVLTLLRDGEMTTYYPDLGTAKRYSVGKYQERTFEYFGARGSLEELMKYFSLTANFPESSASPYHLVLEPRYSRVEKRLSGMEIWIDGQSFLPSRLLYVEANGDQTDYRFEQVEINSELDESLFELDLPDGVELDTVDLKGRR